MQFKERNGKFGPPDPPPNRRFSERSPHVAHETAGTFLSRLAELFTFIRYLYHIYLVHPECQDVDKVNGSFWCEIRFFMTLFESVPTTGREREEFEKDFYGATDPLAAVPRLFYRLPETFLSIPYSGFRTPGANFHTWYDPAVYSQKFAAWNFLSYSSGPLRALHVIEPWGQYINIKAVAANVHHCGKWKPPELTFVTHRIWLLRPCFVFTRASLSLV